MDFHRVSHCLSDVGDNSVVFADVLLNANFADYGNDSSIINTEVAGTTISTSSRLGYRWLNGDRSWMYGLNAGYDSYPDVLLLKENQKVWNYLSDLEGIS